MSILTNAHTHLDLGWLADQCPPITGEPFTPWLAQLVEHRWELHQKWEPVYEAAVEDGILDLLTAGTTHVGDVTSSGKSIGPLLSSGLKGVVYVETVGLNPAKADDYLRRARTIIDEWRPKERNGIQVGLSIHAPYSVHPNLWEKAIGYARTEALPLCIHIAESPAEFDYMMLDTGPLVEDYYIKLNLEPVPSPHKTPIQFLDDLGALELKPLLVHCIHVSEADILRIAATECAVVHCPRANLRLNNGRMPLDAMLVAGVPVYLGSESRAAVPTLDIHDDLETAIALHYGRVPAEAIAALIHQPLPAEPDEVEEEEDDDDDDGEIERGVRWSN